MLYTEAPPEGPGLSSPLQIVKDDPLAMSSDGCRSFNSARVSANPPPGMREPVSALDFDRLFYGNDEAASKDEVPDSAIVPSKIGAGLANLGNTCFVNSILQCFTHTVPFVQGLLSCSHSLDHDGHYGLCVICAFREHIGRAVMSSGQVLSPLILVDNLNFFSSDFRRHQQEDAHEFMQCALDKLDRCFLDLKKKNIYFKDDNIVEKVFGGRLVSKLRCCNCDHSSDTYEPFIDLSLEIENVDTLPSALKSFTMVENIDAKLRCDGCKEEVFKVKQLMLDQTPSIATFHLKRFKTDGMYVEKIDKKIEFPLELDLQPYTILEGNDDDVSLKYDLYAVIVHMGSSSTSGHYYCFVRTAPDTWHDLDDYKVTKVSEETVLSQEAYILFYARQGTPWFSSVADSLVSCLYLTTLNTSPKSVLDIVDALNKPNPTLSTNVERSENPESDIFHSLTPPQSPDNCFKISRDHLKMENDQGSSEKSSNNSSGDPHTQEAIKYLRKHGARRSALLNYVGRTPENKRKQSKKDSPLSARKKPNHASVGCTVAAGTSK